MHAHVYGNQLCMHMWLHVHVCACSPVCACITMCVGCCMCAYKIMHHTKITPWSPSHVRECLLQLNPALLNFKVKNIYKSREVFLFT